VQFNFKLSGDMSYEISRAEPLRFNRPSLHVWRQPRSIHMREWTAPSSHERMVAISVRPEFLLEDLLPSGDDIPARLQSFVSAPGGKIDYCQVPLTAQMMEITTKLIDNPYGGTLYLTYVEALTLELLCAAVAHFGTLAERPTEEYSERELRALSEARRILAHKPASVLTLHTIARAVGLGEKALTRGFKTVYGETLFTFGRRCRMQYALALLRDRQWPVDRVSAASGYAHPTSFASAFRRHFGIRPTDLRRPKTVK
jgi:AraC-like DNA-binding protein